MARSTTTARRRRPPAARAGTGLGVRLCALLAAALLPPSGLAAQSMDDVMRMLREGGRWVGVPIEDGRGTLRSQPVRTFGLPVRGCVQVWEGHSGRWDLRATDLMGAGTLDVTVEPGEQAPFRYRLGPEAQLHLEVEWSERRDTTLLVWVGVDTGARGGEDCRPDRRPRGAAPGGTGSPEGGGPGAGLTSRPGTDGEARSLPVRNALQLPGREPRPR